MAGSVRRGLRLLVAKRVGDETTERPDSRGLSTAARSAFEVAHGEASHAAVPTNSIFAAELSFAHTRSGTSSVIHAERPLVVGFPLSIRCTRSNGSCVTRAGSHPVAFSERLVRNPAGIA